MNKTLAFIKALTVKQILFWGFVVGAFIALCCKLYVTFLASGFQPIYAIGFIVFFAIVTILGCIYSAISTKKKMEKLIAESKKRGLM